MLADWQHCFPGCEPIGHLLREAFPERWVRFHSLPGSKRYAENEAETATILARHNRVLGDLAGPGHQPGAMAAGRLRPPGPASRRRRARQRADRGPGLPLAAAPYDGGMDVIVESPAARDRLKARHRRWLSARPEGL